MFTGFVLPSAEELVLYFNIGALVFVLFFALIGYFRGFKKTLFYFVATVIIFVGGWFIKDIVVNFIRSYNLSSFNLTIADVQLQSLNQFIPDFIVSMFPQIGDAMTEETMIKELVFGLTNMFLRIVFIIILIIFAFTVFKLLVDVLWLIFKPKRKKGVKKRKKSLGNRMGGAGLNALKGAFYLLLILFPIGGIVSIANSIGQIASDVENQNTNYNLIFVGDSATLVATDTNSEPSLGDFDSILELLGVYTKSAPGKIFGTVKADTYLFDSLFSFEVNKTNIKLREELELVAKAFARSESLRENGFSLENLMNEDTDTLKLIVDDLSSLKLIKVAIPMAIEAALYLEDEEGNNLVSIPDGIDLDIDSIMEIDFAGDIKKLGYAFVDFTTLLPGEGEELNYLDLDPDTVSSVLESIGSTDIVDTLLPIAISYITTMESVQESLDQLGFTIDDFGLDEIDDWSNEFTQFGQIYRAVSDLQIKKFDESETFEYVTEDKVDALSEAMFESVLISNSVPVLVNVMSKSIITEEYQDMITVDPDIWDDVEFSALVNAAVTILKSGIVTDGEEAFKTMSSDTIDDLAKYLSRSRFITGNLNTITESLIGDMGFFSEDSEFATLEQDEWTQLELSSLFKAVRFILVEGTDNLTNLEDDKIIEISTYLGSSKFITRNINSVIDSALESIDLGTDIEFGEFKDMEDNEVASNELYYLFKSAKIITDKGSDVNAFLDLNDDELDIFLNSSFISGTLVNVLKAYSKPGEQLEFLVGVDDENVSWYDSDSEETTYTLNGNIITITPVEGATKYNIYGDGVKLGATRSLTFELTPPLPTEIVVEAFIEGELRRMFIAIGSLSSSLSDGGSFSTDTITNLTDEEIDNIMISDILVLSIIGEIEKMANEDEPFIVIPDGNLKSTDQEIKLAAWKNKVDDNVVKDGELSKIFKGLRIFLAGSDIDNFDIQNVTNMPDEDIIEVLKSEIISESIIVQIEKEADKDEAIVVIPEGEDLGKDDPRTEWLNSYTYVGADLVLDEVGELYHILRALRVLVGGGSIDDIDVNNILEEENREIVLTSKVMEMTIINKIIETADEDDAVITIPYNIRNSSNFMAWKKVDGQGEGELRKVLNSLSYLMDDGESITDFNFDLSKVLDNKDEILKSEIFIETIISKISEQSEINIPVGAEYGLNDVEDRSAWQNIYDLDINNNYKYDEQDKVIVTSYGEVNSILEAVDIIIEPDPITGEKSFDNITFNISVAFEANNQEVILSSLVISETILQKVFDEEINGTVTIPSALYLNTRDDTSRDKWFSDYNNGSLVEKNELAHLLDAVNIITDGGDFEGMTFDISKVHGANQELVLKSKVISETIVKKVFDESLNGDVVIPSNIYLNQELDENRDKWYNSYNGDLLLGKGEIAHLIDAVNILTGGETFEGLNFDLSQAFDEVNQPIILQSKVISETIVKKIYDESITGNVKVPSVLYVNELVDPNRDKWFNDYNGDVLTYKGEIAYLLDAVDILTDGDTFEGMNFDLSQAFDEEKQPQILMSKVISETIVKKVFEESNSGEIKVPSDIYVNAESDQSRDKWCNEYNGDVLTYKGEIAYLLDAVDILTGGDTFEGMNFDLSQAFDEVNQPKILMSKVISETIVKKVFEESNSGEIKVPSDIYVNIESDPNRDKWFNDYNGDVLTYKGEIAYLLDAVNILTNGEDFAGMTFDLSQAFDEENQPKILMSKVISETIVKKVFDESNSGEIKVPSDIYVNIESDPNRDKWFNDYNGDVVTYKGEIAYLLDAVNILTGGGNFEGMSFDLSQAFDEVNQPKILMSKVISETIVDKVVQESITGEIKIASTNYLNDPSDPERDKWFNDYNGDVLTYKGEIAYLLDAVNILTNGEDFAGMTFDLSQAFDEENQPKILMSKVISETIVDKIFNESVTGEVRIPSELYVNTKISLNRDKWYNEYDGDLVTTKGEIAHLLDAVDLLTGGSSFAGMSFDLSQAFDEVNQPKILKSKVISETIVDKIFSESNTGEVRIPSDFYVNDYASSNRDKWYNEYNGDVVTTKGEIAHLLDAVDLLTGGSSFAGMSFDISQAFDSTNQPIILKSKVISETIVDKIFNESTFGQIFIPSDYYVNAKVDLNRDKWFNDYNGDTIVYKGEIANLLNAVNLLTGGGSFAGMSFDLTQAFDETNQPIILKSKVISESIVNKVFNEGSSGVLIMPSATYVNPLVDSSEVNRDKWFNQYNEDVVVFKGEIAHLLDAADQILPPGSNFEGMDFDIDALFDKPKRDIILKSHVFAETIIDKILDNSTVVTNVPTIDLEGRSFDDNLDRSAWYNNYDQVTIEENELGKFLRSISLVVGPNSFATMPAITIDHILGLEFNVVMDVQKIITSSDFSELVNSVLMENIIAPLALNIATTVLVSYLNEPANGYQFYKANLITGYDINTFDAASYDLQSYLESLYLMKKAGFDYSNLSSISIAELSNEEIVGLSNSMVASRIFKGSIAKLFNELLQPYYQLLPAINPLTFQSKKLWDDVKLDQTDYNGTAYDAHTNLVAKLTSLGDRDYYYE